MAVPLKIWTRDVESSALKQLENVARLPWVFHHVVAMPDVHWGIGATVGSVIAMKQAVAPAAVGVDMGCGMGAVRLNLEAEDLPEYLGEIRREFEGCVPVGFESHPIPAFERYGFLKKECVDLLKKMSDLTPLGSKIENRAASQLGTLGGGNHFIELCLDESRRVWLMLHSGSRNIGKSLAELHIARAKKLAHNRDLPDPDLAVFLERTPEMQQYRRDLFWAQEYAMLNRRLMMELLLNSLKKFFPREKLRPLQSVWCHHNYVAEEIHFDTRVLVTRKGAISAQRDQWGIIPGSMGSKSYIVQGLGNPQSFCSASHGAGRRMSRGAAKRAFSVEDLKRQTLGVECRKDLAVIDEIPSAYKNIDRVMEEQKDLVEIKSVLKQVLCVKG